MVRKFKQYAANISIIVKNTLVEAHYFIRIVERYYGSLQRVYSIIITWILRIEVNLALQMSFKAINNSIGLNVLVPILLVFSAYPMMIELNASSLSIIQRTIAVQKALNEVQRCIASQQIYNALNTWNESSTRLVYDLLINSRVLIY